MTSVRIDAAPALIQLLLSSSADQLGHWEKGELVSDLGQAITQDAIADVLTLDIAHRTDVDLHFGRENLTGTLALDFDDPNPTWIQVLDTFFGLWRRHAFSVDPDQRPENLDAREAEALDVLDRAHARLLKDSVDA